MHRHPAEPLEAVLLPDPPPRASSSGTAKTWALALGAFSLFVICSGSAFWGLGKLVNLGFSGGSKGSLVYSWESPEEHSANITAAMSAKSPGCTAAEQRELTRFFTKILETLAEEDHEKFRELVDHNTFAHRASLHPVAVASGKFNQGDLESQLEYDLEGPRGWSRFSIVHVARGKAANEVLVYVVCTSNGQSPTPFRWWLRRSGGNWTICDWEMFDLGQSEAARWARSRSIGDDPKSAQYWRAAASIHRADDENAAGRLGAAISQLRDAEAQPLPAAVHDMTQIDLAMAWLRCGRPDLALAACDRVNEPAADVGVLYARARALWELDREAEFLAAAVKYRELAGCHPELLQHQAEALESLGKRQEAADCWWEFLRLMPDDREALFDFCRLAEGPRRAEIKSVLAKSRRPVDRAVEAATAAMQRDETAATEALLEYIQTAAPGSAVIEQLTALQFDYDQQHQQAAEHYLAAHKLETHSEKKRQLMQQYLSSMAAAGKAAEGYAAADDPDAAFEYLTAGYEDDESYVSDEALGDLLAAHRARKPGDARLEYLTGRLLIKQGKYAEAAEAFLKAEASASDDLSTLIRSGRAEALYRLGSIRDAYQAYSGDRSEVFRRLAWLADAAGDNEGLRELIALHLQSKPSDLWINYFTALREQAAGNFSAAIAALLPAESAEDSSLVSLCTHLKTELYLQSDNVTQAYSTGGKPQEAFLRIANRLADRGDWSRVLSLAELHAAAAPNDATALYFATKARWHLRQNQQLVQNLTPWPTDRVKNLDQAWSTEIADLLVRSWLQVGSPDDARKVAEQVRTELGIELPLVAVDWTAGQRDRVEQALKNPLIGRDMFQRQLQVDPIFAALLSDSQFTEMRRRYALDRPNDYGQTTGTILLLLNKTPDEGRWQNEFDKAVGADAAAKVRKITETKGDKIRTSRLADLPGGTLILTTASGPYCDRKSIPDSLAKDSPLRTAVEQHAAWLAVDLVELDQAGPSAELESTAQRLASALCDETVLAIYVIPPYGSPRLLAPEQAIREQLSAGKLLREVGLKQQNPIYLDESSEEDEDASSAAWPKRRRELRQLADQARVEKAAGHAAVRVQFSRGHAQEDLWLNVVRSKRGDYRSEEFIGEVTADSQLWPHLRTGERVRIGFYEPLEVRAVTDAAKSAD